ncbi:hypothetical protein QAD02_004556 [Eretmocerus hayati]|uniref:Uncharacterized protein n=1 Tax=Eretmocerus hayati TaxID=131215 RepID=A0ACC2NSK9_9HYME|nr:hypothetical protein QAD02_004556 [Eretmocerus hayati]
MQHSLTDYYKHSVAAAQDFLNSINKPTENVVNQINRQRRERIMANRSRLTNTIENVIFLGRQNIAFRSHRDNRVLDFDPTINQGNFKELLKFRLDCGDHRLRERIRSAPANASYSSKSTQNDLIQCCDFIKFVNLFKAAHEFDDSEGKSDSGMKITGCSLGTIVVQTLVAVGLNLNKFLGITCDGCSANISETCGAVSVVEKDNPNVVYLPCYSHNLNLSISKSLLYAIR